MCSLLAAKRSGKRRVRVAVDHQDIRLFLPDDFLNAHQHLARLLSVRAGANAEIVGRFRNAELLKENVRHVLVVVLTGVNNHLVAQTASAPR